MTDTIIFTDGSANPNPGHGGYCAVIYRIDGIQFVSGYAKNATNNAMELMAVIKALDMCDHYDDILVVSDSQYVVKGINSWVDGWIENAGPDKHWRTTNDEPVKNEKLWRQLLAHRNALTVQFRWVKGHDGVSFNDLADELSKSARELGIQFFRKEDWAAHGHLFSTYALQESKNE